MPYFQPSSHRLAPEDVTEAGHPDSIARHSPEPRCELTGPHDRQVCASPPPVLFDDTPFKTDTPSMYPELGAPHVGTNMTQDMSTEEAVGMQWPSNYNFALSNMPMTLVSGSDDVLGYPNCNTTAQQQYSSGCGGFDYDDTNGLLEHTGLPYSSDGNYNYPVLNSNIFASTSQADGASTIEQCPRTYEGRFALTNSLGEMSLTESYPPSAYVLEPSPKQESRFDTQSANSPSVQLRQYNLDLDNNPGRQQQETSSPAGAGPYISPYPARQNSNSYISSRKRPHMPMSSNHTPIDKDLPYAQLIYRALLDAPNHTMILRDIYDWFSKHTDKAKDKGKGWQNSIRHNLSMNGAFVKVDVPIGFVMVEGEKIDENIRRGFMWKLTEEAARHGVKSTTRYRSKSTAKRSNNRRNNRDIPPSARQTSGMKGGLAASRRAARIRSNKRTATFDVTASLYAARRPAPGPTSNPSFANHSDSQLPNGQDNYPQAFPFNSASSGYPLSPYPSNLSPPSMSSIASSQFGTSIPEHILHASLVYGSELDTDNSTASPTAEPLTPESIEDSPHFPVQALGFNAAQESYSADGTPSSMDFSEMNGENYWDDFSPHYNETPQEGSYN